MEKQHIKAKVLALLKRAYHETFKTEVELERYAFLELIMSDFKKKYPNINFKEADIEFKKATINWNFQIESRSWGIKSFSINCPDQTIKIYAIVDYYDDEKNNTHQLEYDTDLKLINVTIAQDNLSLDQQISPNSLTYYNKKFTLEF